MISFGSDILNVDTGVLGSVNLFFRLNNAFGDKDTAPFNVKVECNAPSTTIPLDKTYSVPLTPASDTIALTGTDYFTITSDASVCGGPILLFDQATASAYTGQFITYSSSDSIVNVNTNLEGNFDLFFRVVTPSGNIDVGPFNIECSCGNSS